MNLLMLPHPLLKRIPSASCSTFFLIFSSSSSSSSSSGSVDAGQQAQQQRRASEAECDDHMLLAQATLATLSRVSASINPSCFDSVAGGSTASPSPSSQHHFKARKTLKSEINAGAEDVDSVSDPSLRQRKASAVVSVAACLSPDLRVIPEAESGHPLAQACSSVSSVSEDHSEGIGETLTLVTNPNPNNGSSMSEDHTESGGEILALVTNPNTNPEAYNACNVSEDHAQDGGKTLTAVTRPILTPNPNPNNGCSRAQVSSNLLEATIQSEIGISDAQPLLRDHLPQGPPSKSLKLSRNHPWPQLSEFLERLRAGQFLASKDSPAETALKQNLESAPKTLSASVVDLHQKQSVSNEPLKPLSHPPHSFSDNGKSLYSISDIFLEELAGSKHSSTRGAAMDLGYGQGGAGVQPASMAEQRDITVFENAKCIALFLDVSVWEPLVEEFLKHKKVKLTPYLVSQVLKQQKDVDKALGFFQWAIRRKGYVSNLQTNIAMITQLEQAKRYANVWQLIEDMPYDHSFTFLTMTKILECFEKTESIESAVTTFKSLRSSGSAPTSLSYACFIGLLLKHRQVDEAFSLSMTVAREGLLSANSLHFLMEGFAKVDRFDFSCKLFQRIRRSGCKPNLVTYNLLISQYGKLKKVIAACNIFQLIKRDGLHPDATSYLTLINAVGKNGKVHLARQYFEDLKILVGKPSATAYACLMDAYGRVGKELQALKLYDEMKVNEIPTDIVVYSTLFHILGRAGDPVAANRLLGEMRYKKCEPDLLAYNQMIDCFSRNGWIQKAFDIFGEMRRKGIVPDIVTYCALIHGLGSKGEALKAFELFEEMVMEGFRPNVIAYNLTIKALACMKLCEQAFQLYEQMPSQGCQPDAVTFSILFEMCIANGDATQCARLFNDLRTAGVTPDRAMKKIIVQSLHFLKESQFWSRAVG